MGQNTIYLLTYGHNLKDLHKMYEGHWIYKILAILLRTTVIECSNFILSFYFYTVIMLNFLIYSLTNLELGRFNLRMAFAKEDLRDIFQSVLSFNSA